MNDRARIPVAAPWITDREVELVAEAARMAWGPDHYAYNRRFEELFAEYIGVRHAVSLPHATAGLHLLLAAAGVGPGDEVIVPDVTWIASVAPVVYVGASPVLVDIDPLTWCIDPASAEAAVTPRTKAIIGVDLYGSMCNWPALAAIAERHGLVLIEDAAEALGSALGGRRAGAFGIGSAFSFHGSKTVVTGEGGMLATDDEQIWKRSLVLRDHGRPPGDRHFLNSEIAFKYKMSAVQAAMGLAQMERIDELIAKKRAIFAWYRERLGDVPGLMLNAEPNGHYNSYWMVTVVPDERFKLDKFRIMARLAKEGIDSRPFFSPLSNLDAIRGRNDVRAALPADPNGYRISYSGVNLPSGYDMDEEKVEFVCRRLRMCLV